MPSSKLLARAFRNPGTESFDVLTHGGETVQLPTVADAHRNGIKVVPESCPELTRKDRITKALGSVSHIPRVHEEPLSRYHKYLMQHSVSDMPRNRKKARKPSRNNVNVASPQTTAQITRGANHGQEHETQRILSRFAAGCERHRRPCAGGAMIGHYKRRDNYAIMASLRDADAARLHPATSHLPAGGARSARPHPA